MHLLELTSPSFDSDSVENTINNGATTPSQGNCSATTPSGSGSTNNNRLDTSPWLSFKLSPVEAEENWKTFRSQMLPVFRFMDMPETTTPQRLRQDCPLLFLAIMAVTSKPLSQRRALGQDMKRIVIQELMSERERDITSLQALLVFLAWLVVASPSHHDLCIYILQGEVTTSFTRHKCHDLCN